MQDRIDMYLQWAQPEGSYVNTPEEQFLVTKFQALYSMAKGAHDSNELVSPENLEKWRKAYLGTLNALTKTGEVSKRKSRSLRKLNYELVESIIDNNVPVANMSAKYKRDLPLVGITEDYLKYEMDRIYTKYVNDRSERSTYIDGTSWYKVWWDSLDRTAEKSGQVKIEVLLADQVIPQPGIRDYRNLEYIFELQQVSLSRLYDLYGRRIIPSSSDQTNVETKQTDLSTITIINCYYLNEDRIVGKFSWAKNSLQVICNERDWQIRKLRTCKKCGHVQPLGEVCEVCGSKSFKYENAQKDILTEDLVEVYNPYELGETNDPAMKDQVVQKVFLTAGTEVPFYVVRQLPFVPRPAVSSIDSIYGISTVMLNLEMQDATNKVLTKAMDKTLKSGAVITKPAKARVSDTDESFKQIDVKTAEEAAMFQCKQIVADTSQDLTFASIMYESAKSSSGVTDSFQGKYDASATSGKAKQFQALQSAGRIESMRVMKAAAFAGVYELVLKYLLAFSNDKQTFVKTLPDGTVKEEVWSKYMFLDKDEYGTIYYRDDFTFNSDPAATLSRNRTSMWQETQEKFTLGAFGDPSNPRTLELYWNIMDQQQYPLSKVALAGIKQNEQKIPYEIEVALQQNPQLLQQVVQLIQSQQQGGQGGARAGAGRDSNGFTHSANVQRTNERNRAAQAKIDMEDSAQNSAGEGAIR